MPKKDKLSKEERSQIAKDRWAKIKATKKVKVEVNATPISDIPSASPSVAAPTPEAETPRAEQEEVAKVPEPIPAPPPPPPVVVPSPQLTPVAPKRPKRYTGPKEFSVALKAAENRLAKAINERAEAMGKLAGLNAEIPSLLQIIQALKGSNNLPPTPFDFSGGVPNAQAFQAPIDPQAALMAAMAAPPVSRASGGAVQFSPDVVGSLEGPDDDDPDRFITGPQAGPGWIGG